MTHLVEKKPPFVESNTVQNCHNCEHAFIDSRINCRACGNVVCDECSKNRIWLPYLPEGEPENVCDNCFDKIQVKCASIFDNNFLILPYALFLFKIPNSFSLRFLILTSKVQVNNSGWKVTPIHRHYIQNKAVYNTRLKLEN
uniref:arrestin domain-containing protein D-like isoform X1 n=1 Tax=Styela clava TaxID=7725 RepID=UPI00193A23AF|nr:arrestin domain-containing protein D-like isoform X1 [Styela clava]